VRQRFAPLHDIWTFSRFLWGLPSFLKKRMSAAEAATILQQRLAQRDENLLHCLKTILKTPQSPYRALMETARCEFADVAKIVEQDGIESALGTLRRAGVYVTFEEFKGREPMVRNGREIPVTPQSFDNPLQSRAFQVSTGGSTGRGSPVAIDLEHLWASIPARLMNDSIHGFVGIPTALWFDDLPGNGPNSVLTRVPYDNVPERWFSPIADGDARPALKFRLAQASIISVSRLAGTRLPKPEPVRLDQAAVVARWAEDALKRHGSCGIRTLVSRALRICLAAEELGIDLTGAIISGGGEPPTPAKVSVVRRTGARWISNYIMQEIGAVGSCCANAVDENDQHLLLDHVALIAHPRTVPGFDVAVDAFHVSTLLPSARKIMLNVELDDYGVIETRDCGCPWQELGFRTHLRGIRSFRKLTGEGMTLIGTDMVRILEHDLPQRFGGSPLDYQLLEEEDERGFTRLSIIVSPHIHISNEQDVVEVVMKALSSAGHAAALSRTIWGQAGTLRVRRMQPIWTNRGKLMPLHFERHLTRDGAAKQ
jgi:hypothetical protein